MQTGIDELDEWAMESHFHIQVVYAVCSLVGYMIAIPFSVLLAILGGLLNGIMFCVWEKPRGRS
jgi:hypothetical protein